MAEGVGVDRPQAFRVQGSGFRLQASGFRIQGSGVRGQGSGFRVHVKAMLGLCADATPYPANFIGKEFKFKNNLSRRFWPL